MIPKIIHYCWFTKEKKHRLPDKVREALLSWKRCCPDWKIMLWNFDNIDVKENDFVIQAISSGTVGYNYLSDYIKLKALYKFGGICLNSDQRLDFTLSGLIGNTSFLHSELSHEVNFIGAERLNPVVKGLIEKYQTMKYFNPDTCKINKFPDPIEAFKSSLSTKIYKPSELNGYTTSLDLDRKSVKISIVMPVRNGEKYLKDCIDSVLSQTFKDFEFIIVNDGSTDLTESIVRSYSDDRIVWINEGEKKSRGISETLNIGIARSSGKYIARMDADDKMYSERLEIQYNWMESHTDIDICGSGFEWGNGKPEPEYYKPITRITDKALIEVGNFLGHPTVMMRKSSLQKLPYLYEAYYDGAEDLKLWITAIRKGLKISNIQQPLLYYRQHSDQVTEKNNSSSGIPSHIKIKNLYTRRNSDNNELTCIIPFKNEGTEIERTVASIRATSETNIILVDDGSTDGYDYKKIADEFGCDYYRNEVSLGVAGGRNFGVEKCKTEYFVLLDGHMRFYDNSWEKRVLKHLKNYPESIINSNSSIINKRGDIGIYCNENGKETDMTGNSGCRAAVVNMFESGWEFTSKWTCKSFEDLGDNLFECSSVMGAFYSTSKTWWNKIGGLDGLLSWGLDEPLMSIKTFLAGGKCYLLRNFYVGHLYRGRAPYNSYNSNLDSNHLYLINIFAPLNKIEEYESNLKKRLGENRYKQALGIFNKRRDEAYKFREHFWSSVATKTWEDFLEYNKKFY